MTAQHFAPQAGFGQPIDALAQKMLDAGLTDDERLDLLATLDADPAACARFVDYAMLHAGLRAELEGRSAFRIRGSGFGVREEEAVSGQRTADSQKRLEAWDLRLEEEQSEIRNQKSEIPPPTPHPSPLTPSSSIPQSAFRIPHSASLLRRPLAFSLFVSSVATVAFLMLAAQVHVGGLGGQNASNPVVAPLPFVAQLTGENDCRWGERSEVVFAGAHLRSGQVLDLEQGLAEVKFKSGAVAVVEGPAVFTLDGKNAGRLDRGKLVARVATKEARGFTVQTSAAKVIDIGTEFGIEIDSERQTIGVHVFEGRVSVESLAGKGQRLVQSGQSVYVDAAGGDIQPLADSRPERFVRKLPSTAPIEPVGLRRGLAAYWNFDGLDGEKARNVAGSGELDGALIGGAKLSPGGKFLGALDLSSPGDYVKVSSPVIPDGATAYTVSAWFKPARMTAADRQRLFETFRDDGNEAWSISAELNEQARVQYNIKATTNRVVYRSSFVMPDVERWHHLVVVADLRAQGSWLYVNGDDRVEARGAPAGEFVPSTGLNIGTHRNADRHADGQWFLGQIDDMAIWNRALSAREIAELWNDGEGRPVLVQP